MITSKKGSAWIWIIIILILIAVGIGIYFWIANGGVNNPIENTEETTIEIPNLSPAENGLIEQDIGPYKYIETKEFGQVANLLFIESKVPIYAAKYKGLKDDLYYAFIFEYNTLGNEDFDKFLNEGPSHEEYTKTEELYLIKYANKENIGYVWRSDNKVIFVSRLNSLVQIDEQTLLTIAKTYNKIYPPI